MPDCEYSNSATHFQRTQLVSRSKGEMSNCRAPHIAVSQVVLGFSLDWEVVCFGTGGGGECFVFKQD